MNRIYFYKMTVDNGGAPHVKGGVLSLAICKPPLRRTAKPGDLVFGFAANSMRSDNALIYVAKVTQKVEGGGYYTSEYAHRGDCIYERRGTSYVRREGALYHTPADLTHDLGKGSDYPSAIVLLSGNFTYFGGGASADYKGRHREIKDAVEGLKDGHRVNHVASLRRALEKLADEVLTMEARVLGDPTDAPSCGVCLRDDEVCVVEGDEVQTYC